MANNQNWNQIGDQFKGAVNDALRTGNFTMLNGLVVDTVNNAIDEAKRQTQNAIYNNTNNQPKKYSQPNVKDYQKYKQPNQYKQQPYKYNNNVPVSRQYQPPAPYTRINKVGQVGGVLSIVFGSIATVTFSVLTIVFGSIMLAGGGFSMKLVGIMALCTLLSISVIKYGSKKISRINRAKRYLGLCGQKMYVEIESIASHIGKKKKYVIKDIRNMLELGLFPQGHMDDEETCLIVSNEVYKTYIDSKKYKKNNESETKLIESKQTDESDSIKKQLDNLMMSGVDYIYKIRNINDQISEESISEKLFTLENLLKDIFAEVKKQPDKIEQMERFMEYYLPTTLKLVEAYADFDTVKNPGNEIVEAKKQIEKTLDTINSAFTELLNNMFRDKVFDVTTDAQVLQTILSKDGLIKEELNKEKVPVEW